MKNTLRILPLCCLMLLSACSYVREQTQAEAKPVPIDMSQSSLADLTQHLAFGNEDEKNEAAYRIGALALQRNDAIVSSQIAGTACPDKKDFLVAVPPLQSALRSGNGKLQYEAASSLLAIGPLDEATVNGLSIIAASKDPNLQRALGDHVNYLFVPPCAATADITSSFSLLPPPMPAKAPAAHE